MQRIEQHPAILEDFRDKASHGRLGDAVTTLNDYLIAETTLSSIVSGELLTELRARIQNLQQNLGMLRLIPNPARAPNHVSTHERGSYQLHHYDMTAEFARAFESLRRYNVHATRADVSEALHAWLTETSLKLSMAEQIRTHYSFGDDS